MKNKKYHLQKDLVFLTFSLFLIVACWIALNLYEISIRSTLSETLQLQITPISGIFDTTALDTIERRLVVQPDYSIPIASVTSQVIFPEPTQSIEPELPLTPTDTVSIQESLSPTLPIPTQTTP